MKKVLSIALAAVMILSAFPIALDQSANAVESGNYKGANATAGLSAPTALIVDTSGTTSILRIAKGLNANSMKIAGKGENGYILKATPSGVPSVNGTWNSMALGGESVVTPQVQMKIFWPESDSDGLNAQGKINFKSAPAVETGIVNPGWAASGEIVDSSTSTVNGVVGKWHTFTWLLNGADSQAQIAAPDNNTVPANQTIEHKITFQIDNRVYTQYAYSVVKDVISPNGVHVYGRKEGTYKVYMSGLSLLLGHNLEPGWATKVVYNPATAGTQRFTDFAKDSTTGEYAPYTTNTGDHGSRLNVDFSTSALDDGGNAIFGMGYKGQQGSSRTDKRFSLEGSQTPNTSNPGTPFIYYKTDGTGNIIGFFDCNGDGSQDMNTLGSQAWEWNGCRPMSTLYLDAADENANDIDDMNLRLTTKVGENANFEDFMIDQVGVLNIQGAASADALRTFTNSENALKLDDRQASYTNVGGVNFWRPNYGSAIGKNDFSDNGVRILTSGDTLGTKFVLNKFTGDGKPGGNNTGSHIYTITYNMAASNDPYADTAFSKGKGGTGGCQEHWRRMQVAAGISVQIIRRDTTDLRNLLSFIESGHTTGGAVAFSYNGTSAVFKGTNPQSDMFVRGWDAYIAAYRTAKNVLATYDATQTEVNNAVTNLLTAYNNLTSARINVVMRYLVNDGQNGATYKGVATSSIPQTSIVANEDLIDGFIDGQSYGINPNTNTVCYYTTDANNNVIWGSQVPALIAKNELKLGSDINLNASSDIKGYKIVAGSDSYKAVLSSSATSDTVNWGSGVTAQKVGLSVTDGNQTTTYFDNTVYDGSTMTATVYVDFLYDLQKSKLSLYTNIPGYAGANADGGNVDAGVYSKLYEFKSQPFATADLFNAAKASYGARDYYNLIGIYKEPGFTNLIAAYNLGQMDRVSDDAIATTSSYYMTSDTTVNGVYTAGLNTYFKWEPKPVEIRLYSNAGTGVFPDTPTQVLNNSGSYYAVTETNGEFSTTLSAPAAPAHEWMFNSYYTDETLSTEIDWSEPFKYSGSTVLIHNDPNSNVNYINIYADYADVKNKVKFNLQGGEFEADQVSEFSINADNVMALSQATSGYPVPVREGYTFRGWTNADGTIISGWSELYASSATGTNAVENGTHTFATAGSDIVGLVAYAKWEANDVTITFVIGNIPNADVSRFNSVDRAYTFTGSREWLSGTYYAKVKLKNAADQKMSTYDLTAADAIVDYAGHINIEASELSKIAIDPVRFGKQFVSWRDENTDNFDFYGRYPTGDITLYAYFNGKPAHTVYADIIAYENISNGSTVEKIEVDTEATHVLGADDIYTNNPIAVAGDTVDFNFIVRGDFYASSQSYIFAYDADFYEPINTTETSGTVKAIIVNPENEYISQVGGQNVEHYEIVDSSILENVPFRYYDGANTYNTTYGAMVAAGNTATGITMTTPKLMQVTIDPNLSAMGSSADDYKTKSMQAEAYLINIKLKIKDDAAGQGSVRLCTELLRTANTIDGDVYIAFTETSRPINTASTIGLEFASADGYKINLPSTPEAKTIAVADVSATIDLSDAVRNETTVHLCIPEFEDSDSQPVFTYMYYNNNTIYDPLTGQEVEGYSQTLTKGTLAGVNEVSYTGAAGTEIYKTFSNAGKTAFYENEETGTALTDFTGCLVPEREGYAFLGWFLSNAGNGKAAPASATDYGTEQWTEGYYAADEQDGNYYVAAWEPEEYTLTFHYCLEGEDESEVFTIQLTKTYDTVGITDTYVQDSYLASASFDRDTMAPVGFAKKGTTDIIDFAPDAENPYRVTGDQDFYLIYKFKQATPKIQFILEKSDGTTENFGNAQTITAARQQSIFGNSTDAIRYNDTLYIVASASDIPANAAETDVYLTYAQVAQYILGNVADSEYVKIKNGQTITPLLIDYENVSGNVINVIVTADETKPVTVYFIPDDDFAAFVNYDVTAFNASLKELQFVDVLDEDFDYEDEAYADFIDSINEELGFWCFTGTYGESWSSDVTDDLAAFAIPGYAIEIEWNDTDYEGTYYYNYGLGSYTAQTISYIFHNDDGTATQSGTVISDYAFSARFNQSTKINNKYSSADPTKAGYTWSKQWIPAVQNTNGVWVANSDSDTVSQTAAVNNAAAKATLQKYVVDNSGTLEVHLIAKWTPNNATVRYLNNLSSTPLYTASPSPKTAESYTVNYSYTAPFGYSWDGKWNYNSGVYTNGTSFTIPALAAGETIDFVANLTANSYKVEFKDASGKTSFDQLIDVTYNTAFNKPADPAAPTGFTFLGWATSSSAAEPDVSFATAPVLSTDNFTLIQSAAAGEKVLTLYAVWEAADVTYDIEVYYMGTDGNYGEKDADASEAGIDATFGGSVSVSDADYAKTGFTFDSEESNVLSISSLAMSGNVLKVYFKRNKYTLTVDKNDGSTAAGTDYYFEETVDVPDPTKDGYSFEGWTVTASTISEKPSAMPAEDVTLTAIWTEKTYTVPDETLKGVYFDANEGTWANNITRKQTGGTFGAAVTLPEGDNPTRAGYTFNGWSADGELPAIDMTAETVKAIDVEGQVYKAIWINTTYDPASAPVDPAPNTVYGKGVKFMGNSGTWNDGADEFVLVGGTFGDSVTLPDSAPVRLGYTFKGYSLSGNAPAITMEDWADITVQALETGDQVYRAVWEETEYSDDYGIYFNAGSIDGYAGKIGTQTEVKVTGQTFGSKIVTPEDEPELAGYTFKGWTFASDKQGVTAITEPVTTAAVQAMDMNYALEEINPDTDPAVPYKYTFTAQWAITTYDPGEPEDPNNPDPDTIYGKGVIFNGNGGTWGTDATIKVGGEFNSEIAAPAAPVYPGHTFKGWATAANATEALYDEAMRASGVTYKIPALENEEPVFYAVWEKITYTDKGVNFDGNGGTWGEDATTKVTGEFDSDIIAPAAPVYPGHNFKGWAATSDAAAALYDEAMKSSGITYKIPALENGEPTFYAVWEVFTYSPDEEPANPDPDTIYNTGIVFKAGTAGSRTVYFDAEQTETEILVGQTFNAYTQVPEAAPSIPGYELTGWKFSVDNQNYSLTQIAGTQMNTAIEDYDEVSYTAQWAPVNVPVIFDIDGTENPVDVLYDADIPMYTPEPTKQGYEFIGWIVDGSDPETVIDKDETTLGKNSKCEATEDGYDITTRFEAKFAAETDWTVTFVADHGDYHGSYADDAATTVTATYGEQIPAPEEDPVLAGYKIKGYSYYADPSAEQITAAPPVLTSSSTEKKATVYVIWEVETYTVKFDYNTGSGSTEDIDRTYVQQVAANYPAAGTKYGYSFLGWATASDAVIPEFDAGKAIPVNQIYTAANADNEITLYAVYEGKNVKVVYTVEEPDGNETIYKIDYVPFGASFKTSTYSDENYSLAKWNDGTDDYVPGADYKTVESLAVINFTGVLTSSETFTATFKLGAANAEWPSSVEAASLVEGDYVITDLQLGDEITAPAEPTRAGYEFSGWDSDVNTCGGDQTFTATWLAIEYEITYDVDGEKVIYTTDYEADYNADLDYEGIGAPDADNAKPGYDFAGWFTGEGDDEHELTWNDLFNDEDGKIEAHAKFTASAVTVKFDYNGGAQEDDTVTTDYEATVLAKDITAGTKTGSTFLGWAAASDAELPLIADGADVVVANIFEYANEDNEITLYAVYEANNISIKYYFENNLVLSDTGVYGMPATVLGYSNDEYTVTKWHKGSAEGETVNANITFNIDSTSAIKFYATIEDAVVTNPVTVTFLAAGGLFADQTDEKVVSNQVPGTKLSTIVASIGGEPTKAGSTFLGWDSDINTIGTEDITLTATWAITERTVYFDFDPESTACDTTSADNEVLEIAVGDLLSDVATQSEPGYEYSWKYYKDTDYETEYTQSTMPDYDLYARVVKTAETYYDAVVNYEPDGGYFGTDTEDTAVKAVTGDFTFNEALTDVPAVRKDGYEFNGWKDLTVDGAPTEKAPVLRVDLGESELTLTAQWTAKTYTPDDEPETGAEPATVYNSGVTFNANGGTFAEGSDGSAREATFGEEITPVPVVTRTDYTFVGWSTDANAAPETIPEAAKTPVLGTDIATGEVLTYYAIWQANTDLSYTVTYIAMGVDGEYDEDAVYADTIENAVAGVTVTRADIADGPNFAANVAAAVNAVDGTTDAAVDTRAFSIDTAKTAASFTVANGGNYKVYLARAEYSYAAKTSYTDRNGEVQENTVTITGDTRFYGEEITLPAPDVTGYELDSWTAKDGNNAIVTVTEGKVKVPVSGVTATATLKPVDVTVKFYKNYSESDNDLFSDDTEVAYNGSINVPAATSRTGYVFNGFYTARTSGTKFEGTAVCPEALNLQPNENDEYIIEYYAQWTVKTYNPANEPETGADPATVYESGVAFDKNAADAEFTSGNGNVRTAVYGQAISPLPVVEREGYDFNGWFNEYEETPTETPVLNRDLAKGEVLTYKASWTAKTDLSYTVTYIAMSNAGAYDETKVYTDTVENATAGTTVSRTDIANGTDFAANVAAAVNAVDGTTDAAVDTSAFSIDTTKTAASFAVVNGGNYKVYLERAQYSYTATASYGEGQTASLTTAGDTRYYGAEVTAPEINVEGWVLDYWTIKDADEAAVNENAYPFTMPASAVNAVATLKRGVVTVSFYDATDPVAGEWSTSALSTEEVEPNGNLTMLKDGTGDDISALTKQYFVFDGWYDVQIAAGAAVPEGKTPYTTETAITEDTNLYAHYTREVVKLVPTENSTAMIERNKVVETYNEFSEGDKLPVNVTLGNILPVATDVYDPTSNGAYSTAGAAEGKEYDEFFVYGLSTEMTEAKLKAAVTVQGDGVMTITVNEKGGYSTGAKITVTDSVTGQVVEEFYVVVYGDINGDGYVTSTDSTPLLKEGKANKWSKDTKEGYLGYLKKAADLNHDNFITSTDDTPLTKAAKVSGRTLDQKTGWNV